MTAAMMVTGSGLREKASFLDVFLESLSYLTDGAWGGFEVAFEALDGALGGGNSSAREAARVLSSLGHIDLQLDRRTLRPVAWSVAPPVLLRIGAREWVLCGRRASAMVADLFDEAARRGVRVHVEPISSQPARVVLEVPDESSAEPIEAIATVVRDRRHQILVNAKGAASLANALPTLADILDHLHHSTPAIGGAIERLEPDGRGGLKWSRVVDFASRGAYRFDPPPLTYAFVEHEGTVPARVDPRLARLLALLAEGIPPLAWDPATGTATAAYYAEPPALFERALALSRGYGPEPSPYERLTRYRSVSEDIAVALYSRLSTWEAESSS
jgi:hypothetical protein